MKLYLGVHRFAPTEAILGDFGWQLSRNRRKLNILKLWNKLCNLDNSHILKKVFLWDHDRNRQLSWSNETKHILSDLNCDYNFDNLLPVDINYCTSNLALSRSQEWSIKISESPKLEFYNSFKTDYKLEPFIYNVKDRKFRSVLAKLRCGILPLCIETGRWKNIPRNERLCKLCNNTIENEIHFVFFCDKLKNIRDPFFTTLCNQNNDFMDMEVVTKLKILMSKNNVFSFAKFLDDLFTERNRYQYV